MARQQPKPSTDTERGPRETGWSNEAGPARSTEDLVTSGPAYTRGEEPEGSRQQDEHRGLAAKILDLRKVVEDNRLATVRELGELRQRTAHVAQALDAVKRGTDRALEEIQQMQRDLDAKLREGGEQVRAVGELARKMRDQVQALEELREMAADPHDVIKPLQRAHALLAGDLQALAKTIDVRFEQLPKARAKPFEERAPEEDPIFKMGVEIRKLKERIRSLEDEKARA